MDLQGIVTDILPIETRLSLFRPRYNLVRRYAVSYIGTLEWHRTYSGVLGGLSVQNPSSPRYTWDVDSKHVQSKYEDPLLSRSFQEFRS